MTNQSIQRCITLSVPEMYWCAASLYKSSVFLIPQKGCWDEITALSSLLLFSSFSFSSSWNLGAVALLQSWRRLFEPPDNWNSGLSCWTIASSSVVPAEHLHHLREGPLFQRNVYTWRLCTQSSVLLLSKDFFFPACSGVFGLSGQADRRLRAVTHLLLCKVQTSLTGGGRHGAEAVSGTLSSRFNS